MVSSSLFQWGPGPRSSLGSALLTVDGRNPEREQETHDITPKAFSLARYLLLSNPLTKTVTWPSTAVTLW